MLKKRIIGVVTIKNGMAVQSFGYERYLPIGNPQIVVENLNRWGVDEILINVIDRSYKEKTPDLSLIKICAKLGLDTPLIYGGGIHSADQAVDVIKSGADRVLLDSILHLSPDAVKKIGEKVGVQAVIGSLPVSFQGGSLKMYNYITQELKEFSQELFSLIKDFRLSEIMLVDYKHEGIAESFSEDILNNLPPFNLPLILFGGISSPKQLSNIFSMKEVNAVGIGNFLNYKEHALQVLKEDCDIESIRKPFYRKGRWNHV